MTPHDRAQLDRDIEHARDHATDDQLAADLRGLRAELGVAVGYLRTLLDREQQAQGRRDDTERRLAHLEQQSAHTRQQLDDARTQVEKMQSDVTNIQQMLRHGHDDAGHSCDVCLPWRQWAVSWGPTIARVVFGLIVLGLIAAGVVTAADVRGLVFW